MLADINQMEAKIASLEKEIGVRDN